MSFVVLFICYLMRNFMRNGITVDDLGMLLVVVAVVILITVVIRRAACLLALIAMEIVRDTLFRRNLN
ncbi:hypothetical protein BC826DRAFT_1104328 [Russula brevipes]|nr:hypothetical protein BC826DRAFT_1104328 [Russula brevipes]